MDQCAPGFVSNVVLAGEQDGGARRHLGGAWACAKQVRQRLHLSNPALVFLAGCSATYTSREALESILSDDAFGSQSMSEVKYEANTNRRVLIRVRVPPPSDNMGMGGTGHQTAHLPI